MDCSGADSTAEKRSASAVPVDSDEPDSLAVPISAIQVPTGMPSAAGRRLRATLPRKGYRQAKGASEMFFSRKLLGDQL